MEHPSHLLPFVSARPSSCFSRQTDLRTTGAGAEDRTEGITTLLKRRASGICGSFSVWRCLGQVQSSTSSTRTQLSLVYPLPPHLPSHLRPFSPPLPSTNDAVLKRPPTLAMDSPQTSSSANDIFSISDQTLADRLQFIEEVRRAFLIELPGAAADRTRLSRIDWIRELGKRLEMLS